MAAKLLVKAISCKWNIMSMLTLCCFVMFLIALYMVLFIFDLSIMYSIFQLYNVRHQELWIKLTEYHAHRREYLFIRGTLLNQPYVHFTNDYGYANYSYFQSIFYTGLYLKQLFSYLRTFWLVWGNFEIIDQICTDWSAIWRKSFIDFKITNPTFNRKLKKCQRLGF